MSEKVRLHVSWRESGPVNCGPFRNVSITRPLCSLRWPWKTTPELCQRVERGLGRLCGYFVVYRVADGPSQEQG